jgi:hypothetical protein
MEYGITGYEVVGLDCFVFDIIEQLITRLKKG